MKDLPPHKLSKALKINSKDIPETKMQSPEQLIEMNDINPIFQTFNPTPSGISLLPSSRPKPIIKKINPLEVVAEKTARRNAGPKLQYGNYDKKCEMKPRQAKGYKTDRNFFSNPDLKKLS